MMKKSTKNLINILKGMSENAYVERPCRVVRVHSQDIVDIEYYDKYKTDILCKVPVKHFQSNNTCVFVRLKVGDKGTVRFFDSDVSYYNKGSEASGNDDRSHNINDGIFIPGYFPLISGEQELSDKDFVIKSGKASISIDTKGNIEILGNSITILSDSDSVDSKTTIDGSKYLSHTHTETGTETNGVNVNSQEGG